jgi:cytochrome c553
MKNNHADIHSQQRTVLWKVAALCIGGFLIATLSGCTNIERSRDWSNSNTSGVVLAEQVCSTCHGIDGQSKNSLFPKLAGQQKNYILGQLEAIKGRDRNSEHTRQFMWGPARYLTGKQMDEIATYFSEQAPMSGVLPSTKISSVGQVIYHQGIPAKGVQACASCHGDKAEGDDVVPRLAGQHEYYLNSRARIAMTQIVSNLSDDEIKSVSEYLESIGEGGSKPSTLTAPTAKVEPVTTIENQVTPKVFDADGDANNCHYSVWTYGWYCGSFWQALAYHLKNQ